MFKLPFKLNFKRKEVSNTFLTIDIGSQTVKCLAFRVETEEQQKVVKLIGIGKEWLETYSVKNGSILDIEKVAKAADSAIYKATEGLEQDINDVIFGISGGLCTCLVTTGKATRGKGEPITKQELVDIDKKIVEAAFIKAQDTFARTTGDFDVDLSLITTSTVYSKIDGTLHKDLENVNGNEIETALFTAFTPKHYLTKLEELASLLNLNIIAVTSNLYAVTEVLKKDNEHFDGIIIDIGSDTTDTAIIFGGGILTAKSLQVAGNHFTRQISDKTGLTFAEAEKKKYDYTFGHMNDSEAVQFENDLEDITQLWLDGLELMFHEFDGVKTFAPQTYLIGGGCRLPTILEGLQNIPWTKAIPFKQPPEFSRLNLKNMKHIVDTTGSADKPELIVPISLAIIYLELNT